MTEWAPEEPPVQPLPVLHSVPAPVSESDEFELRVELDEATSEALEVADNLANAVASGSAGPRLIASLAAEYLRVRQRSRWLRRELKAAVSG